MKTLRSVFPAACMFPFLLLLLPHCFSKPTDGKFSDNSSSNATVNSTEAGSAKKGVCISQGGRFPAFELHNQKPRKIERKRKSDEFPSCRLYKEKTCCGRSQSEMAFVSVRRMIIGGEGSEKCIALWEALECAICHPLVGTQPGLPAICGSFCDLVLDACSDAFFALDGSTQAVFPCGPRDTICARGYEWATNGTQLCKLAGFRVIPDAAVTDPKSHSQYPPETQEFCFNGDPKSTGLDFGRKSKPAHRSDKSNLWLGNALKWASRRWKQLLIGPRELGDNVVWLVAGLVLTAAASWMRWARARARRNRAALFASRAISRRQKKA